jgi:Secretion system C-terminal sorting domain
MKNKFSFFIRVQFYLLLLPSPFLLAQFGSMPPFTISVEAIPNVSIIGLHSGAMAQLGNKLLYVGGRTNGLHGLNSNSGFPGEYKNEELIVIDTTDWTTTTASLNQLPLSFADPLRSANMQYIQDGNYLYMIGGYGWDSIVQDFVTFPTLSSIDVSGIINAIEQNQSVAPFIRQISNTELSVCGGEFKKLNNEFYLMYGHEFMGRYSNPSAPLFTQQYSNSIKKFNINNDGINLSISSIVKETDTINFHRRDLNTAPIVFSDGSFGIGTYGGVFKPNVDLPFLEPIIIGNSSNAQVSTYQQQMSHYTTSVIPLYDSISQKMYTVFLGGISMNKYNETTNQIQFDSLVPFISSINTLTMNASNQFEERIMPNKLPGLLGSNSTFVLNEYTSHYTNGVIKFRNLSNNKNLIGYMIGGIRATTPNLGLSYANDSVYRIYLSPDFSVNTTDKNSLVNNFLIYPNPANNQFTLYFDLKNCEAYTVEINDLFGNKIIQRNEINTNGKSQKISISTTDWKNGMYFCNIKNKEQKQTFKLIINH